MDKKGEIITLGIFIVVSVLALGIMIYENSIADKQYLGDSSNYTVYNLRSNNSECNLQEIKIERKNIELFKDLNEAEEKGYNLSRTCY